MNKHEARVRDYIDRNGLDKVSMYTALRRIAAAEFGELAAAQADIPKSNVRYSSLIFEDHVASTYLLQWKPGDPGTEIHDHGASAGCALVLRGSVKETIYLPRTGERRSRLLEAGRIVCFGPNYIHKFEDGVAGQESLSLHIYEPSLDYMNFYQKTPVGIFTRVSGWQK